MGHIMPLLYREKSQSISLRTSALKNYGSLWLYIWTKGVQRGSRILRHSLNQYDLLPKG